MVTRRNAAGKSIQGSEVELMHVVLCQSFGSHCSRGASIIVYKANGYISDNVTLVSAGSDVSVVVEDDDDWYLGDISHSKNNNVLTSVGVDFTAIPMRYHCLNPTVPDRACNVFGLALQDRDTIQESADGKVCIGTSETSEAKQFAKVWALESHVRDLFD